MTATTTRLWTDRAVDFAALGLLYLLEDFASELGTLDVPRHMAEVMGGSKRDTDRALAWLAGKGLVICDGTCVRICGRIADAHAKAHARARAGAHAAASRWASASAFSRASLSLSEDQKRREERERAEGGVGETTDAPAHATASKPQAKRGTRLPADWSPKPETLQALEAEGIPNPGRFLTKFRDHWAAAAGRSAVKIEWDAAYRNWCRRELEYAGVPTAGGAASVARDVQNTPEAMRSRLARVV